MKIVTCVGLCAFDLIFDLDRLPTAPGKHFANGASESLGGPAATAAATVARLGGTARFVSRIGGDIRGDAAMKLLSDAAIHARVERVDFPTPVSAVLIGGDAERTNINYTDPDLFEGAPDAESFTGSAAVLADVRWPAGAVSAMEAATKLGVPGILDLDTFPESDLAAVQAAVRSASHVVASRPGLALFTGKNKIEDGLSAIEAEWTAVTDGASGVRWPGGEIAPPEVKAVDTLGAGDVFHGAFALALAEGEEAESALRFASAAAALKCTASGGWTSIPERRYAEELMERTWN